MAYSYYPQYYKIILNDDFDVYPADTDLGIKYAFNDSFRMFPPGAPSGWTVANYTTYGDINWVSSLNDTLRPGWSRPTWLNITPYSNPLRIDNVIRPIITTITSSAQIYRGKVLKFLPNNEVIAIFFNVWRSSGSYSLNVWTDKKTDGTLPTGVSGPTLVELPTSSYTVEQAISIINEVLSDLEFYIGPSQAGETSHFEDRRINNVASYRLIIKYHGNYTCWVPTHDMSFITVTNELITDYGPEPEPPGPTPGGDDPYNPGGYSTTGGGPNPDGTGATGTGGLHDDTSDAIPTPSLPPSIATGSGLFTAYNPDASQLADFASNLWNADVTLMGGDLFKLLFGGDAFNAIIGLHLLPVQPTTSGSPINIKLGNWDTGASAPKIINQYVQVPFGSLMLPEYWGNSIDYSPYTRVQLALPYIGIVDVDTDDVLGSNNTLTYNIDVLSGALCATLHCVKGNLSSVIYQWSGSCGVSLPVTGASFNAVMGAIMGIGAAVAGGIALASGPIGAAIGTAGIGIASTALGVGAAGNMYGSVKGKVQKSGAFGANSGALGIMTPYFIVTRPVQSVPETWQAEKGYPSNISAQLGTLTGYTEVSEINLECSGTEAEKKEIIDLLKKGVLF